jgi:hypothetical protein
MHRPLARSQAPRRIPRWAMAGIVAAPVICMLAGLALMANTIRGAADLKPAIGTVASISLRHAPDGTPLYRENIRYRNDDGQELEGSIGDWSVFAYYDIGEEVAILYSDAEPSALQADSPGLRYGIGPYIAEFGAVLLAVVLWFWVEVARQPSSNWFGPPELPRGEAPAAVAGSVRRDRRGGDWLARLARSIPGWVWWATSGLFGIFVLLGLWAFWDTIVFLAGAERTRGEIVAIEDVARSGGGVSHVVTVRYRDRDRQEREGAAYTWLGKHDFAEGEPVDIYYAPDRPDQVRIADFVLLWAPGLFFTLSGVLLIVLVVRARAFARAAVDADWERDEVLFRPQEAAAAARAGRQQGASPEAPSTPPPTSTVRR